MITRAEAQKLRDELLGVLGEDACNTELLLSRLDSITRESGIGAHAALLLVLTHLTLDNAEARGHWEAILHHRERMSEALRRAVGIRVCVLDYFLNMNRRLVQPTLVHMELRETAGHAYPVNVLTGLASERGFRAAVQTETRRARRYDQKLSLVLFDLDRFGEVNLGVGELVADRLLREASILLHNKVRDIDIVGRFGEDELGLVLPETDRNGAFLVADRFRREVESHFSHRGSAAKGGALTVSGGVACYPEDAKTPEELVERAARALYHAKASGKNAVHVYQPERRHFLRVDLEAGRFEVEVLAPREMSAGTARNLSCSGIVFASPEPLDVGEEIEIRLVAIPEGTPSRSGRLRGRVVRLEEIPTPLPGQAARGAERDQVPDRFEIGMAFDLDFTRGEEDLVEFFEKMRRKPGEIDP